MRKALNKHHIDLDPNNNDELNILRISFQQHGLIHASAYHYLLEKFGIKEIKRYIKWVLKNIRRLKNHGR